MGILAGIKFGEVQTPWTDHVTKWLPLYLTWTFLLLFFWHSKAPSSPSRTIFGSIPSFFDLFYYKCRESHCAFCQPLFACKRSSLVPVYLFYRLYWVCHTSAQVFPSAATSVGHGEAYWLQQRERTHRQQRTTLLIMHWPNNWLGNKYGGISENCQTTKFKTLPMFLTIRNVQALSGVRRELCAELGLVLPHSLSSSNCARHD